VDQAEATKNHDDQLDQILLGKEPKTHSPPSVKRVLSVSSRACRIDMWAGKGFTGRKFSLHVTPACEGGEKTDFKGNPACSYDVHNMGDDIGDDVESYEATGDCKYTVFVDDDDFHNDQCNKDSKDNLVVEGTGSGTLSWGLRNDICKVVVVVPTPSPTNVPTSAPTPAPTPAKCHVDMWAGKGFTGRKFSLHVTSACEGGEKIDWKGNLACSYDVHNMGDDIGDDVESFESTGDCKYTVFVDDDLFHNDQCNKDSKDNHVLEGPGSATLSWGLRNDICKVVVVVG